MATLSAVSTNQLARLLASRPWLRRWGPLVLILVLALMIRIGYMPGVGYKPDLNYFSSWMQIVGRYGLLDFYNHRSPTAIIYPPVSAFLIAVTQAAQTIFLPGRDTLTDSGYITLIKVIPVLADLVLIGLVYVWLLNVAVYRWLIPLLLAALPTLVVISAWWGQIDTLYVLLLVATLIALNRDRPVWAWALLAVAVLTKQQSLVVGPIILVVSFRRYGWRRTALGMAIAAGIIGVIYLPFLLHSGLSEPLTPYTAATSVHQLASVVAFNLWFIVSDATHIYPDVVKVWGPLDYRLIGMALVALYALVLLVGVWRNAHKKQEFVWATALYFGVFILLTQIHERYLMPAAILAMMAVVQDRRMWPLALLSAFTSTYNILQVAAPIRWLGLDPWIGPLGLVTPILNCLLLLEVTWIALSPPGAKVGTTAPRWLVSSVQGLLRIERALVLLLVGVIVAWIVATNIFAVQTGQWLADHIADQSRIVVVEHNEIMVDFATDWGNARSWSIETTPQIENHSVSDWYATGAHYLLLDSSVSDPALSERVAALENQGATLLYTSNSVNLPGFQSPIETVMWTFHPQHPLNLTFDDHLMLAGYDSSPPQQGGSTLTFYWVNKQATTTPYSLFIHILNAQAKEVALQPDTPVGGDQHLTNSWRKSEIVFDHVQIDRLALDTYPAPHRLIMGIYETATGQRARITAADEATAQQPDDKTENAFEIDLP